MPFGRVGLSGPERALSGRYRVRPSRKREGDGKSVTPKLTRQVTISQTNSTVVYNAISCRLKPTRGSGSLNAIRLDLE